MKESGTIRRIPGVAMPRDGDGGSPLRPGTGPRIPRSALLLFSLLALAGFGPLRRAAGAEDVTPTTGPPIERPCPQCRGNGREPCSECGGEGKLYRPCRLCDGKGRRTCLRCQVYAKRFGIGKVPCPRCGGRKRIWIDHLFRYGPCPTCRGSGAVNCPSCHGTGQVPCKKLTFDRICPICHFTGKMPCRRCGGTGRISEALVKASPPPSEGGPATPSGDRPRPARPVRVPLRKPAAELVEELAACEKEIDHLLGHELSQQEVREAIRSAKEIAGRASAHGLAAEVESLLRRARDLDRSIGQVAQAWEKARASVEKARARYEEAAKREGAAQAESDAAVRSALESAIRRCDAVADTLEKRALEEAWTALRADLGGFRSELEQAIARADREGRADGEKGTSRRRPAGPMPPRRPAGASPGPDVARGPEERQPVAVPAARPAHPARRPAHPAPGPRPGPAPAVPTPAPARATGEEPDTGSPAESPGSSRVLYLVIAALIAVIALEAAALLRRVGPQEGSRSRSAARTGR